MADAEVKTETPPEAVKTAPLKKTGVALELDIMAKIVKLLESVDDIAALVRMINWINDLLGQKMNTHNEARPRPDRPEQGVGDLARMLAGE